MAQPQDMRICSAGSEMLLATQQQQQRSTSRSCTCDETELSRELGAIGPQDAHTGGQVLPAPAVGLTAAAGSVELALRAAATSAALRRSATYTLACTGMSPPVPDLTEANLHRLGSRLLRHVAGLGGAIRTASTAISNGYLGSSAAYPAWAEPASNFLAEQGGHGYTTIEYSPTLMAATLQHLVISSVDVNMGAARRAMAELPTPDVGDPAYNEKYSKMGDVCKCQLLDELPYPHLLTGDNGELLGEDAALVAWLVNWLAYLAKQRARDVRIFRIWAFSLDPVTRQQLQQLADAVTQDHGLLLRLADEARKGASTEQLWRVNHLDAFCRSPGHDEATATALVNELRAAKSEEDVTPGAAAGGVSSSSGGGGSASSSSGGGGAGSQQVAARAPTEDMVIHRVRKAAHGATSSAGGHASIAAGGGFGGERGADASDAGRSGGQAAQRAHQQAAVQAVNDDSNIDQDDVDEVNAAAHEAYVDRTCGGCDGRARGGRTNKVHEDGSTSNQQKAAARVTSGVALPPQEEYVVALHKLSPGGVPGCGGVIISRVYGNNNGGAERLVCTRQVEVSQGVWVACGCGQGPMGATAQQRGGQPAVVHFEVLSRGHASHASAVNAFLDERRKRGLPVA